MEIIKIICATVTKSIIKGLNDYPTPYIEAIYNFIEN